MRIVLAGLFLGVMGVSSVWAENMKPEGGKRWLAVASTKDLNVAIGIARSLSGNGARVVTSQSSFYAVVLGPYKATTVAALRKQQQDLPELPGDALLSDGSRYIETVWKAALQTSTWTEYSLDKPLKISSGNVHFEVKLDKPIDDASSTTASGGVTGGREFSFTVAGKGEYSNMLLNAAALELDDTAVPQLVFTRYSGGAHCCTKTWIVTKGPEAAGWSLVDAGTLDGEGYWFEDVNGDGIQEILSMDNSFLYAFDSYAASFAPLHIAKLRNGVLDDVSENEAMRSRLKQDVAGMEFYTKSTPDMWKSNGFLAGWVASKIRLGEGEDAWNTVVENFDSASGFEQQTCETGQEIADCPESKLKTVPFLKSLAQHLNEHGYLPLPAAAEKLLN